MSERYVHTRGSRRPRSGVAPDSAAGLDRMPSGLSSDAIAREEVERDAPPLSST